MKRENEKLLFLIEVILPLVFISVLFLINIFFFNNLSNEIEFFILIIFTNFFLLFFLFKVRSKCKDLNFKLFILKIAFFVFFTFLLLEILNYDKMF